MKGLYHSAALLVVTGLLISCSNEERAYRGGPGRRVPFPSYGADPEPHKDFVRAPWELWAYGRDLNGLRVVNTTIIKGDETLRAGDRLGAYVLYTEALPQNLSIAEREALVFRLAGMELAFDKPAEALTRLSDYARSRNMTVDQVSPRVALLFGYAYGRMGEFTQSVSWLARANELSAGTALAEATEQALARLLASVPTDRLDVLSDTWQSDVLVSAKLGEERARRVNAQSLNDLVLKRPFWTEFPDSSSVHITPSTTALDLKKIGVLLPLSGQYAELGNNIKNGIELAVAGNSAQGESASLVIRDSGSSPVSAIAAAEELFTVEQVGVLIGPLLSDEAVAVGNNARARRVPMISFSKRSDFQVGESIFRMAPTADAQITSLLGAAVDMLGYRSFAIVYPDDNAGREFANVFRRLATLRGASIVYDSSYPEDNVEALIQRAKELERTSPDGVFFPDSLSVASQFFSSLGETARKRMHPMGLANWDNPTEVSQSATVFEGALFVSPFFRESNRPIISQFKTTYRERYGINADFLAAEGFDAATMAIAALAREKRENVPFPTAMKGIVGYEGLTGVISADERGELIPTFAVVQMLGGVLQEVGGVAPIRPKPLFSGSQAPTTSTVAAVPTPSATLTPSVISTPTASPVESTKPN